jgi:hypothetical protein
MDMDVSIELGGGELHLLKKSDPAGDLKIITTLRPDDEDAFERIRCPLCDWRPMPSSTWCCYGLNTPEPAFEGCGAVWNTFSTRGRCPACQHQWRWTSCLRCGGWSLHEDWYDAGSPR